MKLVAKRFEELTTRELYEILKSRAEIFVVEQECAYLDPDGMDYESLHVFLVEDDGRVLAYLRAFEKDAETVQMGRVLTLRRGCGLGDRILQEGLREIRERYSQKRILIEAQVYAKGFYSRAGFVESSEVFLEDGIPHIRMVLEL